MPMDMRDELKDIIEEYATILAVSTIKGFKGRDGLTIERVEDFKKMYRDMLEGFIYELDRAGWRLFKTISKVVDEVKKYE